MGTIYKKNGDISTNKKVPPVERLKVSTGHLDLSGMVSKITWIEIIDTNNKTLNHFHA